MVVVKRDKMIDLRLGDCLEIMKTISDKSVDLVVTSPPYNQNLTTQDKSRNLYKDNLKKDEYINFMKNVFIEWYRILKDTGSIMYNYKTQVQDNLLQPAFEHLCQVRGKFLLVGEIIWKYAGNFDSARTRFPVDYEIVYQLSKQSDFYFNDNKEPLTSVWFIKHVMFGTQERCQAGSHPCPYPISLINKIIRHLTREKETVLDPFMGSGTTGVACKELGRNFIGIEIEPKYFEIAKRRIENTTQDMFMGINGPNP
jgi:modification methylase